MQPMNSAIQVQYLKNRFIEQYNKPEKLMMVLTSTGCTGSPSVAMTFNECPSNVNWTGHTEAMAAIIRNLQNYVWK